MAMAMANFKSDQIGDCLYHESEIQIICFESALEKTIQSNSNTVKCRNHLIARNKSSIIKISFLNCETSKIPDGLFKLYAGIKVLDVSNMKLKSIATVELKSLEDLNASNNELIEIPQFPETNNLQKLDLSNNPIERMDPKSLKTLLKLSDLNLAATNLSEIPAKMFWYQENLRTVNLSRNHLLNIDMNLFLPSFYSLEELYLDDNSITILTDLPSSVFVNLKLVSVTNNDLDCNDLQSFVTGNGWLNRLRLSIHSFERNIQSIKLYSMYPICKDDDPLISRSDIDSSSLTMNQGSLFYFP